MTTQLSVHGAKNHVGLEWDSIRYRDRSRLSLFSISDWDFGDLTAFSAIFSNIFTLHAQKRLFMSFW